MLPPDYFDNAIYDLLELYGKLEESIIKDVVRRLVKTGMVTDTASWQVQKLQESGLLYADILKEIARFSDASDRQVQALFEDAGLTAIEFDDEIYRVAGLSPTPLKQSPAMLKLLYAGMKKTNGIVKNLTLTTANTAQTAYINACDLAYMQVSSGAFDYQTAIRNAVKSALQQGATVLYPSGHTDKLDVAIRRSLLTGINQTAGVLQDTRADEMGCDLVETTAHSGARPEHAQWQGKVFSRSGKSKKYPAFIASTGYGTGAGLCGWNCRHSYYPFFEGLSETAYTKSQLEALMNAKVKYNGADIPLYEATQMQRDIERNIRSCRRSLAAFDSARTNSANNVLKDEMKAQFEQYASKLKQQESALKDFCKQTGLYRETNRLQVDGFGKSVSQKAVWANKAVEKKRKDDILIAEIKNTKAVRGEVHLSPRKIDDINSFAFDDNHINDERAHNVSHEMALKWISEAYISSAAWKGRFENYFGKNGVVYVDVKNKVIGTAYSASQFSKEINELMEVLKKNGY